MPDPAASPRQDTRVARAQSPRPASNMRCPRCGDSSYLVVQTLDVQALFSTTSGMYPFDDRADRFTVDGSNVRYRPAQRANVDALDWYASVCAGCAQGAVWRGDELVYPQVSTAVPPHNAMPQAARNLYLEASAVLPHSKRAAAALARAALERLLRELPESDPRAKLDDLIAGLGNRVSPTLWKLLTTLRYLGNDSLHGDGSSDLVALYLDGDAATIVEPIFGAINSIVEEVIVQPAEADRLYAMLPEGVRKSAEQKRDTAAE